MSSPELRAALEAAYRRFREALEARDFAAARGLLELDPDAPPLSRERWEEAAGELEDELPGLSEAGVLLARESGPWGGLYVDLSPEDAEFADVLLVLFHRTAAGWKVYAQTAGTTLPRTPELRETISTHPALQLPEEGD